MAKSKNEEEIPQCGDSGMDGFPFLLQIQAGDPATPYLPVHLFPTLASSGVEVNNISMSRPSQ